MAVKKETTKGTTSLKKRVAAKKTTVKETKEVRELTLMGDPGLDPGEER